MSLAETEEIVLRLFDAENERNFGLLDELMAHDYVDTPLQLRN